MKEFNPNLYDLLGLVSSNCTSDDIKKAFRRLAKTYHPDVYDGSESEAQEMMSKLNEAYEILSDSARRSEYDVKLREYASENNRRKQAEEFARRQVERTKPGVGTAVGVGLGILALGALVGLLFSSDSEK